MELRDFELERYFAKHEFKAPYLFCCSDCESMTIKEVLNMDGKESLSTLLNQWLGYTESLGNPELRHIIARTYQKMDENNILVTSGAEEAIFIFMNVALKKSDHIIVQYPCYQSLFGIAESIGCEITKWEMKEDQNWEVDLNFLVDSIKENTRAIIINNPHNPTGNLMSKNKLDTIIQLARSKDILLFSDEVYRSLEYKHTDRLDAACDIYENAISLGVMSKTFGLAGLRIGWIATKNKDIYNKIARFKDYTSICNSAPSELLATIALKHQDKIIKRNLLIIKENLALLDKFFEKYQSLFSWNKPKAGPIAFPSIKGIQNVEKFCIDLVNNKGVLLLPGNYYDKSLNNVRIGFGRKNMPQCLAKLDEYLQEI